MILAGGECAVSLGGCGAGAGAVDVGLVRNMDTRNSSSLAALR